MKVATPDPSLSFRGERREVEESVAAGFLINRLTARDSSAAFCFCKTPLGMTGKSAAPNE